jgi:hypothetical protein
MLFSIYQKQGVNGVLSCIKKIQNVEQLFVTAWKEWEALASRMTPKERQTCTLEVQKWVQALPTIAQETISENVHAIYEKAATPNKDWKQALQSCFELKLVYKSILDSQIVQKSSANNFRLTRALEPVGILTCLDSEEAFMEALQKSIQEQVSDPM